MGRPSSTKIRRACFEDNKRTDYAGRIVLDCHICGYSIDPQREKWEAEHVIPYANGGIVVLPAHAICHRPKTSRDVAEIAKGRRVRDLHFGIKQRGGSFRNSRWRKKLNGEVVPR